MCRTADTPELVKTRFAWFSADARCGDGWRRSLCRADLLFTLPELLRFLLLDRARTGHDPLGAEVASYKAFRGMLHHGGTNAELRRFGAVVVVERADDDPAQSVYRLTRRNG